MNGILSAKWFGMDLWLVLLLLGIAGICGLLYNRKKKQNPAVSQPCEPGETAALELEALHKRRAVLEEKKQELLEQYRQRQTAEQTARENNDRINSIENAFFREFGLAERIAEIQNCLSMESYTGRIDQDVLYTQLINILRIIRQLEAPQKSSPLVQPQELFIPGWFAMENTANRLAHVSSADQSALMSLYRSQLTDVGRALENQLTQWQEHLPFTADTDKLHYWESRLDEVKQLMIDPDAADNEQQVAAARRLAEYGAAHFNNR